MGFGIIEVIICLIIIAVWFGYITKEQYQAGRKKFKEFSSELKEYEKEIKKDIQDIKEEDITEKK